MTDVSVQTDDILINGVPLHEFIKEKSNAVENDESVWDFLNDSNSDTDCDDCNNGNEVAAKTDIITYSRNEPSILLSEKDIEEMRESMLYCIEQNIVNNPLSFSDPDFHVKLENSIYEIIDYTFSDNSYCSLMRNDVFPFTEEMENQFEEIIANCLEEYFDTVLPPRSYPATCILHPPNIAETTKKIEYLKSIPQDEQRTAGWYIFRNKLITASAAWKVFKSESCINQLIYEKCKPLAGNLASSSNDVDDIDDIERKKEQVIIEKTFVNTNSPLHWGQKYEKLSVMVYESRNNTKVGEFGCIKHPKYDFLGASPDGINVDPASPLYGRMLEIKNVFNREITGIPIEEYWIQTQLQMQVCDCDECDFLETCFKEYDDEAAFLHDSCSDNDAEFYLTSAKTVKGVIAYFMKDGKPFYEYAPLYLTRTQYDKWCEEIIDKNAGITWLKNIYWYLNQYSCVLIRKNDVWFESAIKKIENVWNTILRERESGYEHRAPKKRTPKKKTNIADEEETTETGCLIVISELELNI
jgi:hypothetical protein